MRQILLPLLLVSTLVLTGCGFGGACGGGCPTTYVSTVSSCCNTAPTCNACGYGGYGYANGWY
jgi:hypothetical protein